MRNKLIKIITEAEEQFTNQIMHTKYDNPDDIPSREAMIADKLIEDGMITTPCVAIVEQFIKDGKLDKRNAAHNGKYAVVYFDKSKWNCPLIDITEQSYNTEKALERIQALKG